MPVVAPFAVASTLDEADQGDMLLFAIDHTAAMHRCLRTQHGVANKVERAKMIDAGEVEAVPVSPYALLGSAPVLARCGGRTWAGSSK